MPAFQNSLAESLLWPYQAESLGFLLIPVLGQGAVGRQLRDFPRVCGDVVDPLAPATKRLRPACTGPSNFGGERRADAELSFVRPLLATVRRDELDEPGVVGLKGLVEEFAKVVHVDDNLHRVILDREAEPAARVGTRPAGDGQPGHPPDDLLD